MEGAGSPDQRAESPGSSPVRYTGLPRTPELRYSGGALHDTQQPLSFDHDFSSLGQEEVEAPDRPARSRPGRPLPPLVRVQAELAAENGGVR